MLCLSESIRYDEPRLQHGLQTAYHAANLTELIVAAWALARVMAVHVVESVLKEWASAPTVWPLCPQCGKPLRSKGFVRREINREHSVILTLPVIVLDNARTPDPKGRYTSHNAGQASDCSYSRPPKPPSP
jgi:hypothetical protein